MDIVSALEQMVLTDLLDKLVAEVEDLEDTPITLVLEESVDLVHMDRVLVVVLVVLEDIIKAT